MHSIKTTLLGIVTATSVLAPIADAECMGRCRARLGRAWRGSRRWLPWRLLPRGRMLGLRRGGGSGRRACRWAGAAVASAARPATVVVQQPAYYPPVSPYYPQGNLALGTQVAYLPPGANSMVVNGVHYYQSGPTWYKPYYGSSGVYYEVVPAP